MPVEVANGMALANLVFKIVIAGRALVPPILMDRPLVPEYKPIPPPVELIVIPSSPAPGVLVDEIIVSEFEVIPVVANVILAAELVTVIGNLAKVIEFTVSVLSELIIAFFVPLVVLVESNPIANLNGPTELPVSLDTK